MPLHKDCADQNLNTKNKTHVNEKLIINNERINNINAGGHRAVPLQRNYSLLNLNYSLLNKSYVGVDASVRPCYEEMLYKY